MEPRQRPLRHECRGAGAGADASGQGVRPQNGAAGHAGGRVPPVGSSFWDVAEELRGPFLPAIPMPGAVFSHPRNLTDEQFTAIIDHNGVVGLTSTPLPGGAGRPGHRHRPPGALAGAGGRADRRFGRRSGRLFQPAGGDHGYSGSGPAVGAAAAAELQRGAGARPVF